MYATKNDCFVLAMKGIEVVSKKNVNIDLKSEHMTWLGDVRLIQLISSIHPDPPVDRNYREIDKYIVLNINSFQASDNSQDLIDHNTDIVRAQKQIRDKHDFGVARSSTLFLNTYIHLTIFHQTGKK